MNIHKPLIGTTIEDACARICEIANDILRPVKMSFNEVDVVAEPGADPTALAEQYKAECRRRHEAYIVSDEYKARQAAAEEADRLRQAEFEAAMRNAPAIPTWIDEAKYMDWRRKNEGDGYSLGCFTFAERWARLMEARRSEGQTIAGCAAKMSHLADTDGITGFMYGCAVSILSQCWTYGDQLRAWHDAGGR